MSTRAVSYHVRREFQLSQRFCLILWLSSFALQSLLFANVIAGMFAWTWGNGWVYQHAFGFYILLAVLHFLVCVFAPFRLWISIVAGLGWFFSIGIHFLLLIAAIAILYGGELRQH